MTKLPKGEYCAACNQWVEGPGPWCALYELGHTVWIHDEDYPSNSNLGMWFTIYCIYDEHDHDQREPRR